MTDDASPSSTTDAGTSVSTPPGERSKHLRLAILVVIAAILIALLVRKRSTLPEFEGLAVGKPAPLIVGNGWLNGPGPKPGDLNGKVVVVEAWGTW